MLQNLNILLSDWRGNISSIAIWLACIGVGLFIYYINVQLSSEMFQFIRIVNNANLYEKTVGNFTSVNISMDWDISRNGGGKSTYSISAIYQIIIDSRKYFGEIIPGSSYDALFIAIKKCKEYIPDHVIHWMFNPGPTKYNPSVTVEYENCIRNMDYQYKPKLNLTPVDVYYNKADPEDNCLASDVKPSNIVRNLIWLIGISILISLFFAAILPNGNIFTSYTYIQRLIMLFVIYMTAMIPGYFVTHKAEKPSLRNNDGYEIVIDQNNSEQYLKDQFAKQKLKIQKPTQ
jgi:hypothetical protein